MASLDTLIAVAMAFSILLGAAVTVFPPKKKFWKWVSVAAFVLIGALNYFVNREEQSRADRKHQAELNEQRQANSKIEKALDIEKGKNDSINATLRRLEGAVRDGATKEQIVAVLHAISEGQEPNGKLYTRGMRLAGILMSLGPDFDAKMRGLQDDADADRIQAKGPEDRARAQQVNDERKRRATAEYLKDLQPLLVEARELQPQLLKRFPGIPPGPSPAVDSLLRTGRPYDGATARDLGEYFRALSLPLGRR